MIVWRWNICKEVRFVDGYIMLIMRCCGVLSFDFVCSVDGRCQNVEEEETTSTLTKR